MSEAIYEADTLEVYETMRPLIDAASRLQLRGGGIQILIWEVSHGVIDAHVALLASLGRYHYIARHMPNIKPLKTLDLRYFHNLKTDATRHHLNKNNKRKH